MQMAAQHIGLIIEFAIRVRQVGVPFLGLRAMWIQTGVKSDL